MKTRLRASWLLLAALTTLSLTLVLLGLQRMRCVTNKYGRLTPVLRLRELAASAAAVSTGDLEPLPWEEEGHAGIEPINCHVVHVLWCGRSPFTFLHVLTVLGAVQAVGAERVVLHAARPPFPDPSGYQTWMEALQRALPLGIAVRALARGGCGEGEAARRKMAATLLGRHGGLVLGERTLLTSHFRSRILHHQELLSALTFDSGSGSLEGVAFAPNLQDATLQQIRDLGEGLPLSPSVSPPDLCVTSERLENDSSHACVILQEALSPRDIWRGQSELQKLARSLLYGSAAEVEARREPTLTHRIAHIGWLGRRDLEPRHFLSVLSCLHVAGLDHVIFHGDLEPRGALWRELVAREAVTHLYAQRPVQIFGQSLPSGMRAETILSLEAAAKYGGLALHPGVLWQGRLPDHLLAFDAVVSLGGRESEAAKPEIRVGRGWPDAVELSVVVTKPGSQFLKAVFDELRHDLRHDLHLSLQHLAYRAVEWRRHVVHVEPRLVVACARENCSSALRSQSLAIVPKAGSLRNGEDGPIVESGWSNLTVLQELKGPVPDLARHILSRAGRGPK